MVAPHPSSPPDVGAGGSRPSSMGAQAQGLASDAKESAETFAEQRKSEGAERLSGIADTASRVADEVADQSPVVADWVRKAATSLDDVSRSIKDRSVGDLLDMAKSFARREPAAFLAASAVAGFALSRLLKSSAAAAPTERATASDAVTGVRAPSTSGYPGSTPTGGATSPKPEAAATAPLVGTPRAEPKASATSPLNAPGGLGSKTAPADAGSKSNPGDSGVKSSPSDALRPAGTSGVGGLSSPPGDPAAALRRTDEGASK